MNEELTEFINSVRKFKLIIVKGLRRYGKTSLILTGLEEAREKYLFIDCRLLPLTAASFDDFLSIIEVELSRRRKFKQLLRSIEHVEIAGMVKFKIRRPETFLKIIEGIGDAIIVFDEAQELRRLRFRLDSFLAYALDHLEVRVVVSGSQVGMLEKFLRTNDPEAPLFGRPYKRVELKPLSEEKSREFLRRGFNQEGIEVPEELIEKAIREFNGVIGWLTHFGYNYARGERSIDSIVEKAVSLASSELEHFLGTRGLGRERYAQSIKLIASGARRWSELKRAIEAKLGRIPDSALANILRNLVDVGIIIERDGEYAFPDPILWRAALRI